jgi:hypothetical protein
MGIGVSGNNRMALSVKIRLMTTAIAMDTMIAPQNLRIWFQCC